MRVTTTKSKSDESFYINYAFINEKGKSTSRIYKKLGKLSELSKELNTDRDGVMAWAKEQARIETEKYKKENESVSIALNPNIPIKKDQQNTFNCGYLFLQSIYYSLHLDNICRNIKNRHDYEYDLNAILSDLIYARFLNPTSKLSSFKYCHSLLEQPTYHLHDIYRALTVLAEESDYIQTGFTEIQTTSIKEIHAFFIMTVQIIISKSNRNVEMPSTVKTKKTDQIQ